MPRPQEYEDLIQTSIMIPRNQMAEVKRLGINLSEVCREALAGVIKNPVIKKEFDIRQKLRIVPKQRLNKIKKLITGNPPEEEQRLYDFWAGWLEKNFDIKIKPEELKKIL